MLERIRETLESECLVNQDSKLLLGVSGGPDSLCLLDIIFHLHFPVVVAHLDHSLRPDSLRERENLEQLASGYGLMFVYERKNVAKYAQEHGLSIEEAARNLRYEFLFDQARQLGAHSVAVGHTADDQVETILMHFMRGAGLSGLSGMKYHLSPNQWDKDIPLIRPLLGTWREEIVNYIRDKGLQPNVDESNLDLRFYRNRLRHELIPLMEKMNPGISRRILQTAEIISAENQILEQQVEKVWKDCLIEETHNAIKLDRTVLVSSPMGIQRRIFRRAISALRPDLRDIEFRTIERAIHCLRSTTRCKRIDLGTGLRLECENSSIWLANWKFELPLDNWPQIESPVTIDAGTSRDFRLTHGWLIKCEILPGSDDIFNEIQKNSDPWQAWLDLDKLNLPLIIRSRLPGERFHPLGMSEHSTKLSDYMINVKIPSRTREKWPLLISKDEIAWVLGFSIGNRYSSSSGTNRILHLSVIKNVELS
jgi:tRNA(Ile)-lysidine synthase